MNCMNLPALLRENAYPGRGIVLGLDETGERAVILYFIMGRSENSRNRVFEATDDGIRTRAYDESRMVDPSLIIYHPVRILPGCTVVTNGDQTDTIARFLAEGKCFEEALRTRTYEPDAPNYTPRISGLVRHEAGRAQLQLSLLRSAEGRPHPQRFFYEYPAPQPGEGRFIHTYERDGDPLPSFEGEPRRVALSGSLVEIAQAVWDAMHPENRVSLYASSVDLSTGARETMLFNKHEA